ncbi:hypothetical protein SR870_14185 [Rhodopseudomonas palustris]|uniref:hypothetical protein n=1 Tax=Rhodopseudomonas palustris TaxID=1076 RepID=UPI002ACDE942|nr:hypothetical protein [Rhodopseudomonas palustris]WQG97858.1 hypothetical protein SR870_14185 [Rhodopseudomonas palustris]
MIRKLALAFGCLSMVAAPALAQAPPKSPPTAATPSSNGCPPGAARVHPPGTAPPGATTGQTQEPLGDKLARSDGVLCPPAGVDPEIRAPTPDTGTMRVIPPPGSPGGDQSVQPK